MLLVLYTYFSITKIGTCIHVLYIEYKKTLGGKLHKKIAKLAILTRYLSQFYARSACVSNGDHTVTARSFIIRVLNACFIHGRAAGELLYCCIAHDGVCLAVC